MPETRHLILATVLDVHDANILYPSCIKCYSKMVDNTSNRWSCYRCGNECDEHTVTWRYRLSMKITDRSTICCVCLFGSSLDQIFGDPASKFYKNLQKLSKSHTDKDEILIGALRDVIIGKSFYFGFKSSFAHPKENVNLQEIVSHCDLHVPSYTQFTQSMDPDLNIIAYQMIPATVLQNSVSTTIGTYLKKANLSLVKDACISREPEDKLTVPEMMSLIDSLSCDYSSIPMVSVEALSQPTICLSCEVTGNTVCQHSMFVSDNEEENPVKVKEDVSHINCTGYEIPPALLKQKYEISMKTKEYYQKSKTQKIHRTQNENEIQRNRSVTDSSVSNYSSYEDSKISASKKWQPQSNKKIVNKDNVTQTIGEKIDVKKNLHSLLELNRSKTDSDTNVHKVENNHLLKDLSTQHHAELQDPILLPYSEDIHDYLGLTNELNIFDDSFMSGTTSQIIDKKVNTQDDHNSEQTEDSEEKTYVKKSTATNVKLTQADMDLSGHEEVFIQSTQDMTKRNNQPRLPFGQDIHYILKENKMNTGNDTLTTASSEQFSICNADILNSQSNLLQVTKTDLNPVDCCSLDTVRREEPYNHYELKENKLNENESNKLHNDIASKSIIADTISENENLNKITQQDTDSVYQDPALSPYSEDIQDYLGQINDFDFFEDSFDLFTDMEPKERSKKPLSFDAVFISKQKVKSDEQELKYLSNRKDKMSLDVLPPICTSDGASVQRIVSSTEQSLITDDCFHSHRMSSNDQKELCQSCIHGTDVNKQQIPVKLCKDSVGTNSKIDDKIEQNRKFTNQKGNNNMVHNVSMSLTHFGSENHYGTENSRRTSKHSCEHGDSEGIQCQLETMNAHHTQLNADNETAALKESILFDESQDLFASQIPVNCLSDVKTNLSIENNLLESCKHVKFAKRLSCVNSIQLIDIKMKVNSFPDSKDVNLLPSKSCLKKRKTNFQLSLIQSGKENMVSPTLGQSYVGGTEDLFTPSPIYQLKTSSKVSRNQLENFESCDFRYSTPLNDITSNSNQKKLSLSMFAKTPDATNRDASGYIMIEDSYSCTSKNVVVGDEMCDSPSLFSQSNSLFSQHASVERVTSSVKEGDSCSLFSPDLFSSVNGNSSRTSTYNFPAKRLFKD